jgi:hypothetical protein
MGKAMTPETLPAKPEGKVCYVWGLGSRPSDNMRVVHKFKNGKSRCKDRHGRKCKLKYPRPNWIPQENDGHTCPECYRLHLLDLVEEQAQGKREAGDVDRKKV